MLHQRNGWISRGTCPWLSVTFGRKRLFMAKVFARFTEQLSAPPVCRTYWTRGQILYKIRRKLVENSLSSYYA